MNINFDFDPNLKDETQFFTQDDANKNGVWSAIAYVPFLFFVPFIADAVNHTHSDFNRFHANQGLLLTILCVVFSIICGIIRVFGEIPFLGFVFRIIAGLLGFALGIISFVLMIIGVINALAGKAKRLPFIGQFNLIK
jgi:uncharacterized membrane protein